MEEEMDILIIKFKSDNKIITNEVPIDITIDRFINIFYAAMVSNGWSDIVIVTAMNQYVNEEDYPYDYSDAVIDEKENNNFIHVICKDPEGKVSVKVEYPVDSTALDIVNILYGLLINLTWTHTTIIRAFRTFVEDNKELIFDGSTIDTENTEYTTQITVNPKEELTATNDNTVKDPFIQLMLRSMKK